eukprot:UN11692
MTLDLIRYGKHPLFMYILTKINIQLLDQISGFLLHPI